MFFRLKYHLATDNGYFYHNFIRKRRLYPSKYFKLEYHFSKLQKGRNNPKRF